MILAQDREPRVPVLQMIDAKLHAGQLDGYRYASMPDDDQTLRMVAERPRWTAPIWIPDAAARARSRRFAEGELDWDGLDVKLAWKVVTRLAVSAFYSHPWAFNEIGFRGPAYPRGYMRRNMGPTGDGPGRTAGGLRPRSGHGPRVLGPDASRPPIQQPGPVLEQVGAAARRAQARASPGSSRWRATRTPTRSTW